MQPMPDHTGIQQWHVRVSARRHHHPVHSLVSGTNGRRSSRERKKAKAHTPGETFVGAAAKAAAAEKAEQDAKDAVWIAGQPVKSDKNSWAGPGNSRYNLLQSSEAATKKSQPTIAPYVSCTGCVDSKPVVMTCSVPCPERHFVNVGGSASP